MVAEEHQHKDARIDRASVHACVWASLWKSSSLTDSASFAAVRHPPDTGYNEVRMTIAVALVVSHALAASYSRCDGRSAAVISRNQSLATTPERAAERCGRCVAYRAPRS
jgi:hypothetical protein